MIIKSLKSFSQNIKKKKLLTDTILENNKNFNVLFIQEPWSIIHQILSSMSEEEEDIIGALYHPS